MDNSTIPNLPLVTILGVPIYAGMLSKAVDTVLELCNQQRPRNNYRVSATGAHGLVFAHKTPSFKKILKTCFINLPDGMPNVWIGRIKGNKQMERCYGPDFFKAVIEGSSDKAINHFFCGGKEGVADQLKKVCNDTMNNSHIVGTFCPPFRLMSNEELEKLGKKIDNTGTNILWIGLSTPKQEIFASKIAEYVKVHFIITVGAAFDFHTGNVIQAPHLIQRMGLEWFFRMCIEPKRLFKRYISIVPLFILYNIKEHTFANHSTKKGR